MQDDDMETKGKITNSITKKSNSITKKHTLITNWGTLITNMFFLVLKKTVFIIILQDEVDELRERAHDLIETKMLFDTDLKLAIEKDPQNAQLLMIRDVINDVFHPRKQDEPAMETNQQSCQQDKQATPTNKTVFDNDFELRPQDIEQIDLIEYLQSAQTNVDMSTVFGPEQNNDGIPSFSLGIDEDIYGQDASTKDNDDFITPKPAMREKSTRVLKLGRFGKSPYIERVIDINAKLTSQDLGLWRFMIQKKEPL